MLGCTILVVVTFFMPWVSAEQGGMVRTISKLIKGEELKIPTVTLSGQKWLQR